MEPSDRLSGKELDAYWEQAVADAFSWGEECRAQRDRLLAYVRATEVVHDQHPLDELFGVDAAVLRAWHNARIALLDEGDITEDDA